MREQFTGFIPPTKNFFHMPNSWIDVCADIDSLAELKVVQYVLRHTWGFKQYDGNLKAISTDEFMFGRKRSDGTRMDKGTGLSNRSVIDGLRAAVDHGYLKCEIDASDKARIIKSYALIMVEADVKEVHSTASEDASDACEVVSPGYEESSHQTYEDTSHPTSEESSQRSEKDTLEINFRNKPKERQPTGKTPNIQQIPAPSVAASQSDSHSSSVREERANARHLGGNEPLSCSQETNGNTTIQETLLEVPLSEPAMTGRWIHEKAVQYAEWCNGRRYAPKMREAQLEASQKLHQAYATLTLEQFKAAYDERNDPWWKEHKKVLHVSDMKAKEPRSGLVRVTAMLDQIETRKRKTQFRVLPSSAPQTPPPMTIAERNKMFREKYVTPYLKAGGS